MMHVKIASYPLNGLNKQQAASNLQSPISNHKNIKTISSYSGYRQLIIG
jgi:hypothetical protein